MEAMGVTYYIFFFNKYLTNVLWIYFHNKSLSTMCVGKWVRDLVHTHTHTHTGERIRIYTHTHTEEWFSIHTHTWERERVFTHTHTRERERERELVFTHTEMRQRISIHTQHTHKREREREKRFSIHAHKKKMPALWHQSPGCKNDEHFRLIYYYYPLMWHLIIKS